MKTVAETISQVGRLVSARKLTAAARLLAGIVNASTAQALARDGELRARLGDICLQVVEQMLSTDHVGEARGILEALETHFRLPQRDMLAYYLSVCDFREGRHVQGRLRLEPFLNTATDDVLALVCQLVGEQSLRRGEYEVAMRVYRKGIQRFQNAASPNEDVLAGCLVFAAEAALGLGRPKEWANFLSRLEAMKHRPAWALEFAAKSRRGEIGLRARRDYWRSGVREADGDLRTR